MTNSPEPNETIEIIIDAEQAGERLDVLLARMLPVYSRVLLRRAITAGGATIDGRGGKPSYRLKPGQTVRFTLPELPRQAPMPEAIPLDILYEDEDVVAVNKPAGMVVHPARGHWSGTLASALQYHFNELSTIGGAVRPGIVHRLDRDTSGVILVARNDISHAALAAQFSSRKIEKEYTALVLGRMDRDADVIDEPIGVHPRQREKMSIRRHDPKARSAQTIYEVIERFVGFSLLKVLPKTGRTHQIRVHLNHVGHPVLCDKLYGGRSQITRDEIQQNRRDEGEVLLARQALHARWIKLEHPTTGKPLEIEAPLADDIATVLEELRAYRVK